jgi:hypothetical protein
MHWYNYIFGIPIFVIALLVVSCSIFDWTILIPTKGEEEEREYVSYK